MTTDDFNVLIEKAKSFEGKEVVINELYNKDSEKNYLFISAGGICCKFPEENASTSAWGKLQLKDGKKERIIPLKTIVQSIEQNQPITAFSGNLTIKPQFRKGKIFICKKMLYDLAI